MRSWGESRTCRATVIRDILRGRLAADPDPHGLRLRGARITGRLDLENLATDVSLELHDCLPEGGLLARDASLECDGAQLRNDSGPALYADRLQVDQSMFLRDGFTATGSSGYGTIWLVRSHIGGHLDWTGATLRNDSGPALDAFSLHVGQGAHEMSRKTHEAMNFVACMFTRFAHLTVALTRLPSMRCVHTKPGPRTVRNLARTPVLSTVAVTSVSG